MKWQNKGHEFDAYWEDINRIERVYIFGAGLIGKSVIKLLKNELRIAGVVDNDNTKVGAELCGYEVYSPSKIDKGIPIIISVPPEVTSEVENQLIELGFQTYDVHVFIPVYFMYKHNRLVITSISYIPTTVCNLKCKNCLNFALYLKRQEFRDIDSLKHDIDKLFKTVDCVMLFHVSGGEPLLYPALGELLSYIKKRYGRQIIRLETTTNGTVVPSEEICRLFAELEIGVVLDDYIDVLPQYGNNFEKVRQLFDELGVAYRTQKVDKWISLMPNGEDYESDSESLTEHFNRCHVPWQEYRDGKIYLCNYSAYASVAGLYELQDDEYLQLEACDKRAIMEFRLGFSNKGYTGFCSRCAGYLNNHNYVTPAEQVE